MKVGEKVKELIVNNEIRPYRVYIDINNDKFIATLNENKIKKNEKLFVITDQNVYNLYTKHIENLKEYFKICVYILKPGEDSKNFNFVIEIYNFLSKNNCERNNVIIAFGGGVVGDIAGFAASTYMRGIRFINVPTTLLSQVDSCIGGKTGFNFIEVKNLIGSYYDPYFVFISTGFLKTLSCESFSDGLGEVIKYGVIKDVTLLSFLSENSIPILEMENDKILHIIRESLKFKAEIIENDYKDNGMRNILNFGHTTGHAIEICSEHAVSHGNAVALGMLVAIKLSEQVFNISPQIYLKIEKLITKLGLLVRYKVDNYSAFLYAINRDKKRINEKNFVLIEDLNQCKIKIPINEAQIISAIKNSISREG